MYVCKHMHKYIYIYIYIYIHIYIYTVDEINSATLGGTEAAVTPYNLFGRGWLLRSPAHPQAALHARRAHGCGLVPAFASLPLQVLLN